MTFDIITLFPKMFDSPFSEGIVGQAVGAKKINLSFWNPRDYTSDKHKSVDDRPFGGGDGMVMLPEILKRVLSDIKGKNQPKKRRVVYLSPQGALLNQKKAKYLAENFDQIVLLCGRYGGIDERIIQTEVDEEISVGDYILSGGELGAMVLIDTVARFIPGVLGNEVSPLEESFKDNLLEHPLYTRPREFEGRGVPEVLLSGNHSKILEWRKEQSILRTLEKRPDLLRESTVTDEEMTQVAERSSLRKNVAIGLVHYPVYNKTGEVVATNVTNFDIHDISRAARTYGVDQYYVITPAEEQLAFVGRVLDHWQKGRGHQYNPSRTDSLINTQLATSVEAALESWGAKGCHLVATSARQVVGPKLIGYNDLRVLAIREPVFILFGTGYGIENSMVRQCEYLLEPIKGRAADGFRHLSVRSAVSIILDRLFGSCY